MRPFRDRIRARPLAAAAWLVALSVAAHFALARRFGLYEDDYAFAGATLNWNVHRMLGWVRFAFGPEAQGRPVGFLLGAFGPWLGYHLTGSLLGMYVLAAAIFSTNAVLFFALLRRAALPSPVPLLAAIAFVLFPAETTRPFLCHGFILQPALLLVLAAFHLYLSGSRWRRWSYLAAVASLLCYETPFLTFLAAPMLVPGVWNRRLPGRWARHAGVLVATLAVAFLLRRWTGEVRAADTITTIHDLPRRIALGCVIGPGVSLRQCAVRLADPDLSAATAALLPLVAVVTLAARRSTVTRAALARTAACGVALAVLAYGLSFTHFPPDATAGRLTSVHMAAAPGVALLVAAAACGLMKLGRRVHLFYPSAVVVGGYFALLFGFAWWVQLGFARQWQEQRTYWTRIVHLCPDATAGTVVLLRGSYPPESDFALTKSWADYRVWGELFELPAHPPTALVDSDGWESCLAWQAGALRWTRPPDRHDGLNAGDPLPAGNTILLEARDYQVLRAVGTATIAGHAVPLKPPAGSGVPKYPRRPLYRLLIGG